MFIKSFELQIVLAYLKIRKFRGLVSIFSFLGILLGVAALIIVTSVMNGFREELFSHIIGINGHINIYNQKYNYEELTEILKPLSAIDQIKQITPVIERQAIVTSSEDRQENQVGPKASGALITGIKYKDLLAEKQILNKLIPARQKKPSETFAEGVLIGSQIANDLNVSVGDFINLISLESTNTLVGRIPRMKKYEILGIFSLGMSEYDGSLIYMPFEAASLFFRAENKPNNINIYIRDSNQAAIIANKIIELTGLPAVDWQTQQSALFNALKIEKKVMFMILILIILIAVFNIISSLFMLVDEKKQSIAILRTLGLSKFSIIKIFVLCGLFIGLIGTLAGSLLGLIFTYNINKLKDILEKITASKIFDPLVYYFENIPVAINYIEIIEIISLTVLLAFLATIPAAYQASKQEPGRVLRY